MIVFNEILSAIDIVSTKNTIAKNVPINCVYKKWKYKTDCYILHTVLLAIYYNWFCNYYTKHRSKQKDCTNVKLI